MSAAFAQNGAEVTLIARGDDEHDAQIFEDFELEGEFKLDLTPRRRGRMLDRLQFLRHVRQAGRRARFDFAYGRSCFGLMIGIPDDVPIAYDLHVFPSGRAERLLEAQLFRRPNFLFATAITKAVRDKYVAEHPSLAGRILVAPCAAKARTIQSPEAPREPGPARIYYVGHLYEGRGIDLILALASELPALEFHIVGGEEEDIARWASRAPGNISFHGHVPPAELPAHYRRADICIAPHSSRVQPAGGGTDIAPWMSPMKIFEYMSYGKAIVAADLPVIREVIRPGRTGLLCPVGDVDAWRNEIQRISGDLGFRRRLGESARTTMERRYTWEVRARTILDRAAEQIAQVREGRGT